MGPLTDGLASFGVALGSLVPAVTAAAEQFAAFGTTLERMQGWQQRHGLLLERSDAGMGDPSQTGVEPRRGPYTSAGYVDEIHHWQGGRP